MRAAPKRPYVAREPGLTSRMMAAVRSRENRAEVLLRRELWRLGLRYRLYGSGLPGRPDLVFKSRRTVVFVDGDFWHGREYIEGGDPALSRMFRGSEAKRLFWVQKIKSTVARDLTVNRQLRAMGWRVIRIWETTVLEDVARAAKLVSRSVMRERTRI